MATTTSLRYRPAIDGLRAVAVLGVFIFHLNRQWLPGGFMGVDVFFVISGYLITSVLLAEYERKNFSLLKFYQRRIARLFPAFFTVALATLIGANFIYLSRDMASCAVYLIAATLSVANMSAMWQGNYFTLLPDATPYLHCWSLSIEEQFYLLFPLGFLLLYLKANREMPAILGAVCVASLIACIVVTRIRSEYAFFLLPTRAWELLAGSILAVLRRPPSGSNHGKFLNGLSLAGLALIILAFFFLHESSSFPGYIAFLPVMGAVLFLRPEGSSNGWAERLLSWSPMVLIGQMSYSLYLWHWPIFSLVDYKLYLASPLVRLAWKVGLSTVATVLCYYFIEKPGRIYLNQPGKRRLAYAFLICGAMLFVVLGISVRKANYISSERTEPSSGGLALNQTGGNGSIILLGDSNGSMYGNMVLEIARKLDLKLNVLSQPGQDPLPHSNGENSSLWTGSLKFVEQEKPDVIILVCNWRNQLESDPGRLDLGIKELKPYTKCLILITQPPELPDNATREGIRNGARPPFFEDPAYRAEREEKTAMLNKLQGNGVIVIDVDSLFESQDGSVVFFDGGGNQVYIEPKHISDFGAELVEPDLLKAVSSQIPATRSGR